MILESLDVAGYAAHQKIPAKGNRENFNKQYENKGQLSLNTAFMTGRDRGTERGTDRPDGASKQGIKQMKSAVKNYQISEWLLINNKENKGICEQKQM